MSQTKQYILWKIKGARAMACNILWQTWCVPCIQALVDGWRISERGLALRWTHRWLRAVRKTPGWRPPSQMSPGNICHSSVISTWREQLGVLRRNRTKMNYKGKVIRTQDLCRKYSEHQCGQDNNKKNKSKCWLLILKEQRFTVHYYRDVILCWNLLISLMEISTQEMWG